MISLYQGTPGSGKSAVAVVDMLEFLQFGGVVACNFDLVPGWHYKLADLCPKVKWGLADREAKAFSYFNRAFKIGTHDTVFELSKRLVGLVKPGRKGRIPEGSGRLYIDEGQLLFNSRDWQKNMGYIEFLTQHRKLGWDVIIIAHSEDMIDKQIRGLLEYEVRLRNLNKVKPFGLFPICPHPAFLCIARYAGVSAGSGEIAWRRLYMLRPEYADLYDSMEVFAFNESSRSVTHHGKFEYKKYSKGQIAPASSWPRYHSSVSVVA